VLPHQHPHSPVQDLYRCEDVFTASRLFLRTSTTRSTPSSRHKSDTKTVSQFDNRQQVNINLRSTIAESNPRTHHARHSLTGIAALG